MTGVRTSDKKRKEKAGPSELGMTGKFKSKVKGKFKTKFKTKFRGKFPDS